MDLIDTIERELGKAENELPNLRAGAEVDRLDAEQAFGELRSRYTGGDVDIEFLRAVVEEGLRRSGGRYVELARRWGEGENYARFMSFLHRNKAAVDYRRHRPR